MGVSLRSVVRVVVHVARSTVAFSQPSQHNESRYQVWLFTRGQTTALVAMAASLG